MTTTPDGMGVLPGQVPVDVRAAQAAEAEAAAHEPTVEELRTELKARGLPTSGKRDELLARLADAVEADEG